MAKTRWLLLSKIVVIYHCLLFVSSISYKEKHYTYIQEVVNRYTGGVAPFVVNPPPPVCFGTAAVPDPYYYLRPTLILWDPVSQRTLSKGVVRCPRCDCSDILLRPCHWKDGRNERSAPRLLFAGTGVTYLVSRVYRCNKGHEIIAHDEYILRQFTCKERLPFLLSHTSGITRDLYNTVVLYSSFGFKIEQIESLLAQQQLEYFQERCEMFNQDRNCYRQANSKVTDECSVTEDFPVSFPDELKTPSNDFICNCIVHDYQNKEWLYKECMAQTTASWFSCDHTFKVAANIGLLRKSDQKWEKQYDSMFCVLNENGVVLAWQLTKGTAFDKVRDLLKGLKNRFDKQKKNITLCSIDNCCAWRKKLQDVFGPELQVKLDLFHAVQRVVKNMPKRHPFTFRCCQAFRLVFRHPSDAGEVRTLPTPLPHVLEENMDMFLKTWKDIAYENQAVLPATAMKEIENLKKHIRKGCLSNIPVGCGSERNENLHKSIRHATSKGRVGVLLAVTLLSSFLYRWNEQRMAKNKGSKRKIVRPIMSRKTELKESETGPSKEMFGIGISNKQVDNGLSLPNVYQECSNSLGEMQDAMTKAFEDQAEPEETTSDSDKECDMKDIESGAFTRALNLYFLTSSLPENVSFATNTDHFHLMGTHGLFSFGTMSSDNTTDMASKLDKVLASYKFEKLPVAPDGDCLFSSIIFQLKQMVASGNSEISHHLQIIGFHNLLHGEHRLAVAGLRSLMVSELHENRVEYESYIITDNIEYEEQINNFKNLGVYAGEIGNVMALSLANVLRVNMVLFTSMDNFHVIPITPRQNVCTHQTLYLAFNHMGSGHYDAIVEVQHTANLERDQIIQDTSCSEREQSKGCGCGRGAAKKKKCEKDLGDSAVISNMPRKFCAQEPGARRTLCPCYREYRACTSSCRCCNCSNPLGERPDCVPMKGEKRSFSRKRVRHELQKTTASSLTFMQRKGEQPADPKWSKMEHILVEVLFDMLIQNLGEATENKVCELFNNIVSRANSIQHVTIPISPKSEAAIKRKYKSIKDQAMLFREFYLQQVAMNFSPS